MSKGIDNRVFDEAPLLHNLTSEEISKRTERTTQRSTVRSACKRMAKGDALLNLESEFIICIRRLYLVRVLVLSGMATNLNLSLGSV